MHAPETPAAMRRARTARAAALLAATALALSACAIAATDAEVPPGPSTGVTAPSPTAVVPTVRAPQVDPPAQPEAPRPVATADGGWSPHPAAQPPPGARPTSGPSRPAASPTPAPPTPGPSPTPTAPTGPTEVATGGPAPAEGALYDLAVVCAPGARFWIDPAAPDGDFTSFAPTTCDATIGHLELGVPSAWARAYAEPAVHASLVVERTPSGTPLASGQVDALVARAPAGQLVDVVIWCITPGTVALGGAAVACVDDEPVWFDGVPLRSALADLRVPAGFEGRGLLQLP